MVVVAFGSNLGDRRERILAAASHVAAFLSNFRLSSIIETATGAIRRTELVISDKALNLRTTVVYARELKARGVDVIDCSSGGISGAATAAQVPRSLGFQVPFAERVRREADIPTMAVGIILEAQQAEAIVEKGQADLIAVGRQSQYNPNIAHHWAHDLGINRRFEDWSPEYGWWLEKRIKTLDGFATPTGTVTRRS